VNNLLILENYLKLKNTKLLLEVGCNQGLTTQNLSKIKKLRLLAIDENQFHLNIAKKKLAKNNKVQFKKIDFFKIKNKKKFDIILFREFFNIFTYNKNIKILKKSEKILNSKGIVILIDFYRSVIIRSKLIRFLIKSKELTKNQNKFLKSPKDYKKYFNDRKWEVKIINKDLLNQHISFKSRILEMIFPVKYTLIATKKK